MTNVFEERLAAVGAAPLRAQGIETLQVNVGLRCNLSCAHCHLEASPGRPESMAARTMAQVLRAADAIRPRLVDITGGAPEMHPRLREFIAALRAAGHAVQVRTNLAILTEPGWEDFPAFFRDQRVRLVASLPCYLEENVDRQRGIGTHHKSIAALRGLNRLGYGMQPDLELNLVFNPGGAVLPTGQACLERDYRRELRGRHGVEFTHLLALVNLPLGRFGARLRRENREETYLRLLVEAFNPCTLAGLMCRRQIEVAWDGRIFDCDFNLALRLPVDHGAPDHIDRFDLEALASRQIVTGAHCFGCTAGAGSSCEGAITPSHA